jgi:hypothetical protein
VLGACCTSCQVDVRHVGLVRRIGQKSDCRAISIRRCGKQQVFERAAQPDVHLAQRRVNCPDGARVVGEEVVRREKVK